MEDFQDLKNKGFKYHQENNLDNAERCYKKALKINSKNAEAHNLLGLVKLQQNNFEEAIDWIKKAIDIEKNAYFYETLFQALAIQEKYSEIINYENEITEYLEKEFSLNFYLALAYKNLNEIKKSCPQDSKKILLTSPSKIEELIKDIENRAGKSALDG